MTIRRDLDRLETKGIVWRTHGGVVLRDQDPSIPQRQKVRYLAKKAIAEKVVSLLEPHDIIALDAGTTLDEVAHALVGSGPRPLTLVTHGLHVASILMGDGTLTVTMAGGDVRNSTASLVGPLTRQFYERMRIPKTFIAASGVSLEAGLTNSNFSEAEIKRTMIENADAVYLVADSSKFGLRSVSSFASLPQLPGVLTDTELSEEWQRHLTSLGLDLILCELNPVMNEQRHE